MHEILKFAGKFQFTKVRLGTEIDGPGERLYDKLEPSTKTVHRERNTVEYEWCVLPSFGSENSHSSKIAPWKAPQSIVENSSQDLSAVVQQCGAEYAFAGVVTYDSLKFWQAEDRKEYLNDFFCCGSVSKLFMNILISHCHYMDIIDWSNPVCDYLDVGYDGTIEDLAAHGGVSCPNDILLAPDGRRIVEAKNFERVVHNVSEQSKSFTWPYEYNNINTAMLARIIDKASGRKWQELLKTQILEPLDMNSTFTTQEEWDRLGAAQLGFLGQNYLDDVCAAPMGFVTTAGNLAKFLQEILRIKYAPSRSKLISLGIIGSIDVFEERWTILDQQFSLFGTIYPPGTNLSMSSINGQVSPSAETDPVCFYPAELQLRTGNVLGFDSSITFIEAKQALILTGASSGFIDTASLLNLALLQHFLVLPRSPFVFSMIQDYTRYSKLFEDSKNLQPDLAYPPLKGRYVCPDLYQYLEFSPKAHKVSMGGYTDLAYVWKSQDSIELRLINEHGILEMFRTWQNSRFDVIRNKEGVVIALERMYSNGTNWRFYRQTTLG